MKVIEILTDEHKLIRQCLNCMTKATERIVDNKEVPKEALTKAVEFARNFADKYHHYKEEYVMFELLARKHNGLIDVEITRLRDQHEHNRNLVQTIAGSIDGYIEGSDTFSRQLHRALSDYVATLKNHIHIEEVIFFPMVENSLTPEEHQTMVEMFSKYEEADGKNVLDTHRQMLRRMEALLA